MGKSLNTSSKPPSKPAKAASKVDPPLYAPLQCASDKRSKAAFDLYYQLDEPAALLGTLHMTVRRSDLYAPIPTIVASLITCVILLEITRLEKTLSLSSLEKVADKKKFKKETKRDIKRLTKILHDVSCYPLSELLLSLSGPLLYRLSAIGRDRMPSALPSNWTLGAYRVECHTG